MGKNNSIFRDGELGKTHSGVRPTANPRKKFWHTIAKYTTPEEIAKAELDITTFFERMNAPLFENKDHSVITKILREKKMKVSFKTAKTERRNKNILIRKIQSETLGIMTSPKIIHVKDDAKFIGGNFVMLPPFAETEKQAKTLKCLTV